MTHPLVEYLAACVDSHQRREEAEWRDILPQHWLAIKPTHLAQLLGHAAIPMFDKVDIQQNAKRYRVDHLTDCENRSEKDAVAQGPWKCPNDTDGDGDCHLCANLECEGSKCGHYWFLRCDEK